jgi:acetyl esterase
MSREQLHPQVEALRRTWLAAGLRPVHELSVAEARALESIDRGPRVEPLAAVRERTLRRPAGEIRVRIYLPDAVRPLPVLVYLAGGGWVLGSLDGADALCRCLADAASCAIVSVDYRRAPENRFPAALEDCYAATSWIAEHGAKEGLDPERVAIGGASAGGNLAAAVAQLARDRAGPGLVFQLLVYPPLEHEARTQSMREGQPRPFLAPADVAWCWSHYLRDPADGRNPLASPLRATDLHGLPSTLVITAEHDPLRDEGELYAKRLHEASVETELVRFDGVPHGFFSVLNDLEAGADARARAAAGLKRAFQSTPAAQSI